MRAIFRVLASAAILVPALVLSEDRAWPPGLPSPKEMAGSRRDVWAEAAIAQPGGPSYEFFAPLLPPLHYVNAAFRQYPIVLSAPDSAVKARWISDGRGVNLRADKPPMWREVGTPVLFFVGDEGEAFGAEPTRLSEPTYSEGYLPVVQIEYRHGEVAYDQQAFALTREPWNSAGAVLVRFVSRQYPGVIRVRIGADGKFAARDSAICNDAGQAVLSFGAPWRWNHQRRELRASLTAGAAATLLIATQPLAPEQATIPEWNRELLAASADWKAILDRGVQLAIPEQTVQNAWRSLVLGNYAIAGGERLNYSAGNAYDHLYEAECGDAVRALLLFGQAADARRMIGPLLEFDRQATRFHVAGHKLQLLAHYYWITRDADYVREKRPLWSAAADFIRSSRQADNGLLPKDNYAGDIAQPVYSLSSNSNCWRGLRDLSAVAADLGERALAGELAQEAADFRRAILAAVARSERRDTQPPFMPIALLADEPAHDPLTATRMGSYYDLMAPYVLGSGIFALGSDRETNLIEYLRQHGGLALGMIRSMPHQGQFNGEPGVNVLYGQRYMLTILRRGDRDHAVAGFYGHLAHGMTRNTFIGGDGSRFFHGDERGRSFYLPPNSASNAMFLTTLRCLLAQDLDLDDDGRPETLRLFDALPPQWLVSGRPLEIARLPTAFGEMSARIELQRQQEQIAVSLELPPRDTARIQIRLPAPSEYRIAGLQTDEGTILPDQETRFELSGSRNRLHLRFTLKPSDRAGRP